MIPRSEVELSSTIPADAGFWVPRRSEIGDGALGYFHDTWPIRDVGAREARWVIDEEAALVAVADECSDTIEEFEGILLALQSNDDEAVPASLPNQHRSAIVDAMRGEPPVECLEIGVAGLVYALAAAGFWPAASCRGWHSWSPYPVVYFAADAHRVQVLQPLVDETSGGFLIDAERSHLLVVAHQSIADTMKLAERVMATRAEFPTKRGPRKAKPEPQGVQASLWTS